MAACALVVALMPVPAAGWSEAVPVSGLATEYHEFTPWITIDGLRLYFTAVYPGGFGGNDIFYRDRQPDGSWGPIINLGPPINSVWDERAPCVSPDGKTFIFTSYGRPNQPSVTSIYCSHLLLNGQWSEPVPFDPTNSKCSEFTAYPSHDGSRIWFTSYRPGGHGGEDIWCVTQVPGGWSDAYDLDPPINEKYSERTEAVGWGDYQLFFCSFRPFGLGDEDLFLATLNKDMKGGTIRWLTGANSVQREYSPTYDANSGVLYFCRMRPASRSRGMDIYMSRAKLPWGEDGPASMVRLFNSFQHF
jgi:hypothetical protein